MTHEDYVSFEQAQKLKELGFDWECIGVYDSERPLGLIALDTQAKSPTNWNGSTFVELVSAPTLAQVQKWLRKKGINIEVRVDYDVFADKDYWVYVGNDNSRKVEKIEQNYMFYETAFSAGIDKALEILKQK